MSQEPADPNYQFISTPHQPTQHCTARLTQAVFLEKTKEIVEVHIPCGLTAHRTTTRHHYVGSTAAGATVEIYWRDEDKGAK